MKNQTLAFSSIVLLFFMLWAPLGQYEFLIEHWMKIGTYAVPFVLLMFFSSRDKQTDSVFSDTVFSDTVFSDTKLIAVLLLVAYIIHQFEEHWIDLFGHQYAFYGDVNQLLLTVLGAPSESIRPLTPEAIFVINTSLVWLVGAIAIWRSPKHIFATLAMAGITLVNGMSHMVMGIAQQSYNPGLLTAVVLFLPLAIAFYRNMLTTKSASKVQVIASIVWSILAHIIMVAGLLAANWFELMPETAYFAMLIAWSVIPAVLFTVPSNVPQAVGATHGN
ncbi:MAG: HXXEE domain-containing protein [Cyanobacteria bacterium P01_D01_bin.36]